MDNKITIREGLLSDIPELVELLKDLFSIEEDFQFDQKKQENGLKMILESNPDEKIVLAAELEGRVIGMCSAQIFISTAEGARSAMIEDMIVRAGFRGKGIGKKIMYGIVSWAKRNDVKRLQLLSDKNNRNAISFYRQNDWDSTRLICLRRKIL